MRLFLSCIAIAVTTTTATNVLLLARIVVVEATSSSSSSSLNSHPSYGRQHRPPSSKRIASYRTQSNNNDRSRAAYFEIEEKGDDDDDEEEDEVPTSSSTSHDLGDVIVGLDDDEFQDILLDDNDDDDDEVERILLALAKTEEPIVTSRMDRKRKISSGKKKGQKTKNRRRRGKSVVSKTISRKCPKRITRYLDESTTAVEKLLEGHQSKENFPSLDPSPRISSVASYTPTMFTAAKSVSISTGIPFDDSASPLEVTSTTTVQVSHTMTKSMLPSPISVTQPIPQFGQATIPSNGIPLPTKTLSPQSAAETRAQVSSNLKQAGKIPKKESTTTSTTTTTPWIRAFLKQRPLDMLLPVPKDYIGDNFNLAQLPPIVERIGFQAMGEDAIPVAKALQQHRLQAAATVAAATAAQEGITSTTKTTTPTTLATSYPIYRLALRMILKDNDMMDDDNAENDDFSRQEELLIPPHAVQTAAETLYLLVHARFVMSPRGLEAIRHVMMLDRTVFGKCPRPLCRGCGTLPYGYSVDYNSCSTNRGSTNDAGGSSNNHHLCHRYCPSCGEVWISWNSRTDGCAWGPSWCHLFLLSFGTQVYAKELQDIATQHNHHHHNNNMASSSTVSRSRTAEYKPSFIPENSRRTTNVMASSPPPSVFGFRIHPATPFGTPFNEQVLGSNIALSRPVQKN